MSKLPAALAYGLIHRGCSPADLAAHAMLCPRLAPGTTCPDRRRGQRRAGLRKREGHQQPGAVEWPSANTDAWATAVNVEGASVFESIPRGSCRQDHASATLPRLRPRLLSPSRPQHEPRRQLPSAPGRVLRVGTCPPRRRSVLCSLGYLAARGTWCRQIRR